MQDINESTWLSLIPVFGSIGVCLFIKSETIGNMQAKRTAKENRAFALFSKICVILTLSFFVNDLKEAGCYKITNDFEKVIYETDQISLNQEYDADNHNYYYQLMAKANSGNYYIVLLVQDKNSIKELTSQIKSAKEHFPKNYANIIIEDIREKSDFEHINVIYDNEVIEQFYNENSFDDVESFLSNNAYDYLIYFYTEFNKPFYLTCAEPDSPLLKFYKNCSEGNEKEAKHFLQNNKDNINSRLSDADQITFAKYFIAEDDFYSYPIVLAAHAGNEKLVKFLIKNGADASLTDSNEYTALIYMIEKGCSVQTADLLIKAGCNINAKSSDGITAVAMAVSKQNVPVLKKLLDAKASVDFDITEHNPLMYYAYGNMEIIKLLEENGVETTQTSSNGYNGLLSAVQNNKIEAVKYFLSEGINPNIEIKEGDGGCILSLACSEGYTDIVKELIAYGADVNIQDKDGRTPLWSASREGYLDIVSFLLQHKDIDIEAGTRNNCSPFMIAANHNHIEVVKLLLESGADVNKQYDDGMTALSDAAIHKYKEMTELLLKYGSDTSIKDSFGRTPLDYLNVDLN